MASYKKTVKFENKNGNTLFGILHIPEDITKNIAIILLSPGIKSRVAPHRLYVKMAEKFSAMGFYVLRIDPEGLGDSEGEIEYNFVADVYCSLELGRLINDTISAMNWMENEYNLKRFILSGLCGGAITGLLTAAFDSRVDSLLGLGLTSILASDNIDTSHYITRGELYDLRDGYLKKIFRPSSWLRFLTLKSDYKLLFKALILPAKSILNKYHKTENNCVNLNPRQEKSNLNPHFPAAFARMASKNKMLLIFSERDRLYWEFKEKYMDIYGQELNDYMVNMEIKIVKDANHIFSFKEWQEKMLQISCNWLSKVYE
jgi:hypothetical protein